MTAGATATAGALRLSRTEVRLDDGRRVGVCTAGSGVPLVMVHGFGVESLLYAQSLSRLAGSGLRVVAVDLPGHGDSDRLAGLPSFADHVAVVADALDHLGIRRALFMGHSMGGRVVAELAAREPWRALGLLLLAPIVGEPWERRRQTLRWAPPALALYGVAFALDTIETVPVVADTRQALKLSSRVRRSLLHHAARPWRGLVPGQAVLRAPSSQPVLERLAAAEVPTWVLHGERDRMVPYAAGVATAREVGGELITIKDGTHSWMLTCPESLPAIVGELRAGSLGRVLRGVDPAQCVGSQAMLDRLAADGKPVPPPGPQRSAQRATPRGTQTGARRAPRLEWQRTSFAR